MFFFIFLFHLFWPNHINKYLFTLLFWHIDLSEVTDLCTLSGLKFSYFLAFSYIGI